MYDTYVFPTPFKPIKAMRRFERSISMCLTGPRFDNAITIFTKFAAKVLIILEVP
jgi:hypothetical protein